MYKISYIAFIAIAVVFSASCHKSYDVGTTNAQKAANSWWVVTAPNGDTTGQGHIPIISYNVTDQSDSLWIDDQEYDAAPYKVKVKINFSALTFSGTNVINSYGTTATVTDGKILPKAGHTRAGNIADSIYFKIVLAEDPTTTYTVAGVAHTGFLEDNYY
jgi:hypothetical protein